jgi:hypothetical protein
MKYMCLICAEKVMEDMSEVDAQKHYQEYAEFTEGIKKSGRFISANRLKPASSATTIRVRNNAVDVTDGPFAETKEQLGGYYVIEARDLNEAIQVASKIPGARFGCVELRPIAEDAQTRALGLDASPSLRRPEARPA